MPDEIGVLTPYRAHRLATSIGKKTTAAHGARCRRAVVTPVPVGARNSQNRETNARFAGAAGAVCDGVACLTACVG